MINSHSDRVENTLGKGKNAGQSGFSPFPTMLSKAFLVVKSQDCMVKS